MEEEKPEFSLSDGNRASPSPAGGRSGEGHFILTNSSYFVLRFSSETGYFLKPFCQNDKLADWGRHRAFPYDENDSTDEL